VTDRVRIVEVGPRDGLQNEPETIPASVKTRFIQALAAAGLPEIEVGSFVSPRWVPQLAATEEVVRSLGPPPDGTIYTALVPNKKGLERAVACGIRSIAVFTAASETFNRRNTNATIAESLERFRPVIALARAEGLRVRGYVSTAFVCPYEGQVAAGAAVRVVADLLELGVEEASVGDTIGAATPRQVREFLGASRGILDPSRLAFHFHDTRGTALANVLAALDSGIRVFDASAGGIGGCPYAPGATGNLATEDLLYLLDGMGIATGVSLDALTGATEIIEVAVARPLPSKVYRARRAERARGTA
jgi:hydroxymethylglutaryl-CoA lyase